MTSPVRVPATGPLADLLDIPAPLLDITLDQLRTLLVVHHTGSPLAASRILGREHSSIRKQLDTLRAAVRDAPEDAAVTLKSMGWQVTPPADLVEVDPKRLRSF